MAAVNGQYTLEMKRQAVAYFNENKVPKHVETLLNQMFKEKPEDIYGYMSEYFGKIAKTATISKYRIATTQFNTDMKRAAPWNERGKGSCPQCHAKYSNRYKPKHCEECSFPLGGTHVPKKKRPVVPKCTFVANIDGAAVYSANTSTHDDRCIVVLEGDSRICHLQKCKEQRAVYVNSGRVKDFKCLHLKSIENSTFPLEVFKMSDANLTKYVCGETVHEELVEARNIAGEGPVAIKVSPYVYCVHGRTSTNNPMGLCHVKVGKNGMFVCTSKECKGMAGKAKQEKARKICLHIHVLLCLGLATKKDQPETVLPEGQPGPSSAASSESVLPEDQPGPSSAGSSETITESFSSLARQRTIDARMELMTFPYEIPSSIIRRDALKEWPQVLQPTEVVCQNCKESLPEGKEHPGSRGKSIFISEECPFQEVMVKVKVCGKCGVMHQAFPYELGLFNINDKVIVSIEIMMGWRHQMKRGVAPMIAIESKLEALSEKANKALVPTENEMRYIANLLYNGFYCFEACTRRDLDTTVCGICGVIGEVYFGDGNEKNCCSVKQIDYATSSEAPVTLEEFNERIRRIWVECNTYSRCEEDHKVVMSEIPPIIPPCMRKQPTSINTESSKKSQHLEKHRSSKQEGDPALLHLLIMENKIDIQNIDKASPSELENYCKSCSIKTSNKTQARMRIDLQSLYETLLVGTCPCHGFTKVPGHTGGFYHIVCRHGVTVASKFLTLQESVRDPADLYLSLRFPPIAFVLDTPCGFVRHLDCRAPDVTAKLWGEQRGCFEKPNLNKIPTRDINIPLLTTAEFRAADKSAVMDKDPLVHPLTGSTQRYSLGDRFHTTTNPHKSALCAFHDINLLLQSNTIKTSYQESANNSKNVKRLSSSTGQKFTTHFLYNYLMDFYQNEKIVKGQVSSVEKIISSKQYVARDEFHQFVIKDR